MSSRIWVVFQTWTGYQDDGAPIAVYTYGIETVKKELEARFGQIKWKELDDGALKGAYSKSDDTYYLYLYPLSGFDMIDYTHVDNDLI